MSLRDFERNTKPGANMTAAQKQQRMLEILNEHITVSSQSDYDKENYADVNFHNIGRLRNTPNEYKYNNLLGTIEGLKKRKAALDTALGYGKDDNDVSATEFMNRISEAEEYEDISKKAQEYEHAAQQYKYNLEGHNLARDAVTAKDFEKYAAKDAEFHDIYNVFDDSESRMSGDEKKIYNYFYNKYGAEKAQEYMYYLRESLNARAGSEKAGDVLDSAVLPYLSALKSGVQSFGEGLAGWFTGDDDKYKPISAEEYKNYYLQQGMADRSDAAKMGYDLLYSTGNMIPSIALGAVVSAATANPIIGGAVGSSSMGLSAGGNSYEAALKEGYSPAQAATYGIVNGALEGGLQYALGGIGALGGKVAGKVGLKLGADNTKNTALRLTAKIAPHLGSEFSEEYLQEVIDRYVRNAILDEDNDTSFFTEEALYNGILGALTAGLIESGPIVKADIKTSRIGQNVLNNVGGSSLLEQTAASNGVTDLSTYTDSKGNIKPYQAALLYGELGLQINENNKAQIEAKLVEKGLEQSDAAVISEALASVSDNDVGLSEAAIDLINDNDAVKTAVNEYLVTDDFKKIISNNERYSELVKKPAKSKKVKVKDTTPKVDAVDATARQEATKTEAEESTPTSEEAAETRIQQLAAEHGLNAADVQAVYDNGSTSADGFAAAFNAVYLAGKNGSGIANIIAEGGAVSKLLTGDQIMAAYRMGVVANDKAAKAKAAEKNNSTAENNTKEEKNDEKGDGVRVRRGGERADSENTAEQVRRVAERSRPDKAREAKARPADSEADTLTNGKEIKRINGIEQQGDIYRVNGETDAMRRAKALAEKHGYKTEFFMGGNAKVKGGEARGIISTEKKLVAIRADHPKYDAYQIMCHEMAHDAIAKGDINLNEIRTMLEEHFTAEELDDMAAQYAAAFTSADGTAVMTAEEAFEEICCDALGGINVFAEMGVDLRIDYPVLDTIRGYVNDSETAQSRAPPSKNGGVKYSQDSSKTPIELSDISTLSERIGNKRGSERYNIIRDFILEELAEQPITLSDGRKAIVDRSDALHMANKTNAKKTAEVSQIKQIVENAELVAEENSKKDKKFSHFYYYEAPVKYNNDVFNIYLNVGVAKNDKTNHIYDITQKLRDTAQRIAVGRLSKSFALGSGISTKSISENSENVNEKYSAEPNTDELQAKINSAMTMAEAKRMIESAFKIGGLYSFYDGKYRTADEWLKAEGSSEVELYIENELSLQEKYINSNQDILDGEYYISDVLDAYLEGTLVGKEKPKAKRFDTSVSYGTTDSSFYSPQRIEQAEKLLATANERITGENKAAVNEARAKLLLFAHNKGAVEELGLTQAELNKKLRSWSGYSATARKISEAANKGVALENRWTGIENCAYINKARISNEDISELVGSIEGDTNNFERRYIARVMLAADTHISYRGLRFVFESNKAVNERFKNGSGRTKGFFSAGKENVPDTIVCSYTSPDTVAHEMGHYIDVRWGRDLLGKETGSLYLTRGINEDMVRERHGEDGVQFMKNFKIFMDSLTNGNSNISSYTNDYAEVFARFFARFVEWTDNTATGNKSYSYESRMYGDKFTASQYVEFIKLLQEKAMLDAKYEAEHSAKFSQEPMTLKQLEAENKKLKKQLEYWRNQTKKNPKKTVREGDVKKLAKAIVESVETDLKPHEIVPDLIELGNYILNEKELRYTEVHDMAESIAADLVENATEVIDDLKETRDGIRSYLKTNKLIDDGSAEFEEARSKYKRMFRFAKNGESGIAVDVAYMELQDEYGVGLFPDYIINPADELARIAEVINLTAPQYFNPNTYYAKEAIATVTNSIIDGMLDETVRQSPLTTVERYEQRMTAQKAHFKELLEKQKARQERVFKDYKRRQAEKLAKKKLSEENAAIRDKIQGVAKKISKLYNSKDKHKNVKEVQKGFAGAALSLNEVLFSNASNADIVRAGTAYAMATPEEAKALQQYEKILEQRDPLVSDLSEVSKLIRADNRNAKNGEATLTTAEREALNKRHDELKAKIGDFTPQIKALDKQLADLLKRDKMRIDTMSVHDAIDELSTAYAETKDNPQNYASYEEAVQLRIDQLKKDLGKTISLKELNTEQLNRILECYKMVYETIKNANTVFSHGKRVAIEEMAQAANAEMRSTEKDTITILEGAKSIYWNSLLPVYYFEKLGSKTLQGLYDDLMTAQDDFSRIIGEADDFITAQKKKYGFSTWKLDEVKEFRSKNDKKLELTLEERMSLYAYSAREQATEHLEKGGIVRTEAVKLKEGKDGETKKTLFKRRKNVEGTFQISKETQEAIFATLTEEQKNYVKEMQRFLSDTMGAYGNKASMQLYGIELFKEKYYFPLKTSSDYRAVENVVAGNVSLKNKGMTKPTIPRASNPIVLENFDKVATRHIADMATYSCFAIPIDSINKVYHYSTQGENGSQSVRATIKATFGTENATKYMEKFIQDLNGGIHTDEDVPTMKMFRTLKAVATMTFSTTIQQPTAVIRAMSEIDPKYFVHATNDTSFKHKKRYDQIKKYAPVARLKEIGGYDVGKGTSMQSYLNRNRYGDNGTFVQKAWDKTKGFVTDSDYRMDALMAANSHADMYGWNVIWGAVWAETRATTNLEVNSEAFFEHCGKRFTEVVNRTQVYDSTLSRSDYMRRSGALVKLSTAYMGEPLMSFNMMQNAIIQAKRGKITVGHCMSVIASVLISQLLADLAKSAIYAIRRSEGEDDDQTYGERFASALGESMADSLGVLRIEKLWILEDIWIPTVVGNMLPFVRDVLSVFNGETLKRTDYELVNMAYDIIEAAAKEDANAKDVLEKFVYTVAAAYGVPAKQYMRDINGIINTFEQATSGKAPSTSGKSMLDEWYAAFKGQDLTKTDRLKTAMLDGDADKTAWLLSTYNDDDKAKNAYTNACRELYNDGQISKDNAVDYLIDYGYKEEAASKKVNAWSCAVETDIAYNDLYDNYASKNIDRETAIAYLQKYGEKDEKAAAALVLKWDCEIESGFAYNDLTDAFVDGEIGAGEYLTLREKYGQQEHDEVIDAFVGKVKNWYTGADDSYSLSESEAVELLTSYCDYDKSSAKQYLSEAKTVYEYRQKYPAVDSTKVNISAIGKYETYIKGKGIEFDDFITYKTEVGKCKGVDENNDGKTDSGSKRAAQCRYINSLKLTVNQKDALYLACGLNANTLYNTPWH